MAMPVGVLPSSGDVGLDTSVSLDAKWIVRRDPTSTQGLQPGTGPAADVLPMFNAPRSGAGGDDRQRALSALALLGVGGS